MGRPVEKCAFCGAARPRGLRKRCHDDQGKVVRIAACHACKGVPGHDVPAQFRERVRVTVGQGRSGLDRFGPGPAPEPVAWASDHVLVVGDCRERLRDVSGVQLFLSDPPYNIDFEYGGVDDNLPWPEYVALMAIVAERSYAAAKEGGSFVLIHYQETAARLLPAFEAAGWKLHQWCSWVYRSSRGARGRRFSRSHRAAVWFSKGAPYFQEPEGKRLLDWMEFDYVRGGSIGWQGYGCQIPAALLRLWISCLSKPGDVVADPFLGTGSTAKEAVFLGRQAWGCDVNPAAAKLWAPLKWDAADLLAFESRNGLPCPHGIEGLLCSDCAPGSADSNGPALGEGTGSGPSSSVGSGPDLVGPPSSALTAGGESGAPIRSADRLAVPRGGKELRPETDPRAEPQNCADCGRAVESCAGQDNCAEHARAIRLQRGTWPAEVLA